MITAHPANQAPPDGKHVVSSAPGGPRDLSGALARQRAGSDARPTVPAGGWPATVGADPDASPNIPPQPGPGEVLTSPTQGSSPSGEWHPRVSPCESAGY